MWWKFTVLAFLWKAVIHTASTKDVIKLETDYVMVEWNEETNSLSGLYADFEGKHTYGKNVLAVPFGLTFQGSNQRTSSKRKIRAKFSDLGRAQTLLLHSVYSFESEEVVSEQMSILVDPDRRSVEIAVSGRLLQDISVSALTYGVYVNSPSVYGLFSSGVAQMMGKTHACLGSDDSLERAYFLGDGSALDISVSNEKTYETVLISNTASQYPYKSGLEHVVLGSYPHKTKEMSLAWNERCWSDSMENNTVTIPKDSNFSFTMKLIPNNYDFPAYPFDNIPATQDNIPFIDLRTSMTGVYASAAGCLQSYYAQQEGTIAPTIAHPDVGYSPDTNFFDPDNFITLSAMLYSGDTYLVQQVKQVLQRTSETMCGIGSDTIAAYCEQSRQRTKPSKMMTFQYYHKLQAMKDHPLSFAFSTPAKKLDKKPINFQSKYYVSTSRAGQLMHHFVSLVPTYESIAGSEQLGPNIFWTMTVWKYISVTQDYSFAVEIFPFIDLSCKFVLSFIDKDYALINAPGPLWIDVLIREQYTSDSNAIIVPFIEEMIEYYSVIDRYNSQILGKPLQFEAFITELAHVKSAIITAYNQYLWISNVQNSTVNDTKDHFITQLNTDLVSYRDFIDYDSNLMAVAFQIVQDPAQIHRLIERVDSGPYTHVRATWCSEIPYSGDADDCYIVGGDVCGDSVVTLARIGYIDGIARKQIQDKKTYQDLLLTPLQQDLIQDVWLYERYDANGNQIRTSYYFEYPSLITMFVREISYGIEVKLQEIIIHPFTAERFTYNIGNNIYVQYDKQRSEVVVMSRSFTPTSSEESSLLLPKKLKVYGLQANQTYRVSNSCDPHWKQTLVSNEEGMMTTSLVFTPNCSMSISLLEVNAEVHDDDVVLTIPLSREKKEFKIIRIHNLKQNISILLSPFSPNKK